MDDASCNVWIMKVYEIPRGSRIKVDMTNGEEDIIGAFIIFHRLDGRYSYCTVEGTDEVCHLSANQELRLSDEGHYELVWKNTPYSRTGRRTHTPQHALMYITTFKKHTPSVAPGQ